MTCMMRWVVNRQDIAGCEMNTGISVEPMIVPDFPESEIRACMDKIEAFLVNNDTINPWDFAEKNDLDVKLVLLCIDKLISQGKLEW